MVAAAIFWVLLSCVSALYFVLAYVKQGSSCTNLVESLLDALNLKKISRIEPVMKKKNLSGPMALPLIGSLYKLGNAEGPFGAFTKMSKEYGDIYEIQLGVTKCVIVSSYNLIKEVLITKGGHFGGRPNFVRYHHLFGGDRNNSLALCDWSDLQRKRRSIARSFCSPRGGSSQQEEISRVAMDEMSRMFEHLEKRNNADILRGERPVKPIVLTAVANMFTSYMCSTRFGYEDEQFNNVVRTFDDIFWDINQGYAIDFLPWLKIFYTRHLRRLSDWANDIRGFILKRIIEPRRASLNLENEIPRDFTDALLYYLVSSDSDLSWEHILFELEDFLGGHSAVGNLVMMVLANAVTYPGVQAGIQEECDAFFARKKAESASEAAKASILPSDKLQLPYTEAVIWETLRLSSSPIVPHVATTDTDINGYNVAKDTVVFLNNYELNLGKEYWGDDVREFKPERFLTESKDCSGGPAQTRVTRPEFFLPFSTGKRTCIGQKIVQGFSFVIVTMLLSRYNVSAPPRVDVRRYMQPSCLALPPECFNLVFTRRRPAESA